MLDNIKKYRIGIDVGGTTVDFAIVDQNNHLIDCYKTPVNEAINDCILLGIEKFYEKKLNPLECVSIHIGTTIALNSLLELKSLYRVGILRLASHQPDLVPAYCFPDRHKNTILSGYETVEGGREFDNKPLRKGINEKEIIEKTKKLLEQGAESLVIIGTFSPLYPDEEISVEKIIRNHFEDPLPITLSHHIGVLDFIQRENSSIINAALKKVIQITFNQLENALKSRGFQCPIFVTQNNGTLLSLHDAIAFPVKTISSGPTNSLVGACKLAGLTDAIVIDIGGTSTDIGIVENGFPRYSSSGAIIAGMPLHCLMPDIHALAVGGGSVIHPALKDFSIGPDSIGARIFTESKTFGGDYLTLFDIGNILQKISHPNGVIPDISIKDAEKIMQAYAVSVNKILLDIGIERPVVLVGGGAQFIPDDFLNMPSIRPPFYAVANAYGAALAEVSGTVDTIVYLNEKAEETIDRLAKEAIQLAVKQGAALEQVRVIEKNLFPFYYMPNKMTRVVITAAGRLS